MKISSVSSPFVVCQGQNSAQRIQLGYRRVRLSIVKAILLAEASRYQPGFVAVRFALGTPLNLEHPLTCDRRSLLRKLPGPGTVLRQRLHLLVDGRFLHCPVASLPGFRNRVWSKLMEFKMYAT